MISRGTPAGTGPMTRSLTTPTGDGEISFGGRTDVSNLINALEGAAINAAAGATAAAPAAAPAAEAAAVAPAPAPAAQPDAVAAAATGDSTLSQQVGLPHIYSI